jgi:predicted DNA-binding transcriptional regulator YafY
MQDTSPTARALLTLELIQNSPGITGEQLSQRIGLSDRAIRRYVGILREAGIPIESTTGRYGGYRVGRGLRIPPLMFTPPEALGLVMAAVEGRGAADVSDPVGSALAKIIRVLPERVAGSARAVTAAASPGRQSKDTAPDPELTAALVQARGGLHRVDVSYRTGSGREVPMQVDPWAVVVRHGLWYLLCWLHSAGDRRVLRVDRVLDVRERTETFEAPDIDPVRTLEEQLSQGWAHEIEVVVDAPRREVARWIPRTIGRLEVIDETHTRLVASTDEPDWYAAMLAFVRAPFHVIKPPELRDEVLAISRRMAGAVDGEVAATSAAIRGSAE